MYMKLSDKKLVGSVVGSQGSNKRFIESKYGCKIDANLDDGTIRIVGKVEEKVKKSQEMIMDYLSKCSLSEIIHTDLATKIIGPNGDTIENIRKSTKAHVKVLGKTGETRKLLIYGKPSNFELAKEKVLDIIESELKSEFNMQPFCCFREKKRAKGFSRCKVYRWSTGTNTSNSLLRVSK